MTLVTIPHPDIPQQTKTQIWMYGGRSVKTRRVCSGLWCLDVETLVWERVESGEETEGNGEGWPRGRYFHTADRCESGYGFHDVGMAQEVVDRN
jgi:hypothetical protein